MELLNDLYRSAEEGCVALAMLSAMMTPSTFQESMERVTSFTNEIPGTGLEGVLSDFDFSDLK